MPGAALVHPADYSGPGKRKIHYFSDTLSQTRTCVTLFHVHHYEHAWYLITTKGTKQQQSQRKERGRCRYLRRPYTENGKIRKDTEYKGGSLTVFQCIFRKSDLKWFQATDKHNLNHTSVTLRVYGYWQKLNYRHHAESTAHWAEAGTCWVSECALFFLRFYLITTLQLGHH